MANHKNFVESVDQEAVTLKCSKCQANARFLLADPGVTKAGKEISVSLELQDQWLGADCPVEDQEPG